MRSRRYEVLGQTRTAFGGAHFFILHGEALAQPVNRLRPSIDDAYGQPTFNSLFGEVFVVKRRHSGTTSTETKLLVSGSSSGVSE